MGYELLYIWELVHVSVTPGEDVKFLYTSYLLICMDFVMLMISYQFWFALHIILHLMSPLCGYDLLVLVTFLQYALYILTCIVSFVYASYY